ncbi:MAG: hypothetical protein WBZ19_29545, partial [Chthoniobacterales bacterium]
PNCIRSRKNPPKLSIVSKAPEISALQPQARCSNGNQVQEEIDPRRGPMPTEAPEDETAIDSRDLESDKKESDETGRNKR